MLDTETRLLLKSAIKSLDAVQTAIHNYVESEAEQRKADREPHPPTGPERVEVGLSAQEAHRYYGEQDKTYRLQWWTFWATVATFVAVAVYAGITYLQWRTMNATLREVKQQTQASVDAATTAQNALTLARENFRQDQRPYIWFTNTGLGSPVFVPTPTANQMGQFIWTWHFTNYGKTPAYNIRFDQFMQVGDGRFVRSFGSPVGPNLGAPLPPTKDDFATVVSPPGIAAQRATALLGRLNTGRTVAILGWIQYTDSYRHSYLTTFCLVWLNVGSVGYCREGNGIR